METVVQDCEISHLPTLTSSAPINSLGFTTLNTAQKKSGAASPISPPSAPCLLLSISRSEVRHSASLFRDKHIHYVAVPTNNLIPSAVVVETIGASGETFHRLCQARAAPTVFKLR